MCPLTKEPCTDQCSWYEVVNYERQYKDKFGGLHTYENPIPIYGCVVKRIAFSLENLDKRLEKIRNRL
jgi:hypothetical protein